MVKNRGKIQVEGELKTGDNPLGMPNKGIKGSATIRADRDRATPQH
jgi:hypothetical protein